jgi:hypothetical protein
MGVNGYISIHIFVCIHVFSYENTSWRGVGFGIAITLSPAFSMSSFLEVSQCFLPSVFVNVLHKTKIYLSDDAFIHQLNAPNEACHWVLMFRIKGQGVGMLSSLWEKCCSSGVTLAHGWLISQEIQLRTFKVQQNLYQKGWPCALAPSADRLLRTLTFWIRTLGYSAILEVGHVFLT